MINEPASSESPHIDPEHKGEGNIPANTTGPKVDRSKSISRETIDFRQVLEKRDPSLKGFIRLYKAAFAEAPYFESFSNEQVAQVWDKHIGHCVVCAEFNGEVVGLACAHPVLANTEPSIRDFILESINKLPKELDPKKAIFMSELAVSEDARGMGLGTQLVLERLKWGAQQGFEFYMMRTAENESNSKNLYLRLGAVELPIVQRVIHEGIETSSERRIYLWGKISDVLGH
ncbi:MAG: GNAT family N-acetyltransferase [Bdellovibrionota bacterium]